MSPEELLSPRYKVIAADTSEKLTPGEILVLDEEMNVFWHNGRALPEDEIIKYPHLFKKLEWWEEREEVEMPKYLKLNPENTTGQPGIFKVTATKKYIDGIGLCHTHQPDDSPFEDFVHARYFLPATEQDYNNYINPQQ